MDAKSLNLAVLADKLHTGKWMLSGTVHEKLCDQLENLLSSDIDPSKFLTEPPEYKSQDSNLADVGSGPVTGIIPIKGILAKGPSEMAKAYFGFVDVDDVSNALDQAAGDTDIKEIVLDFACPGGESTGIEELGRKIEYIDANIKPVYAFTSAQCCSAAYWLAVNCRLVGKTPSSAVGSVGVYCLVLSEERALKDAGLKVQPFFGGKYKLMGHSLRI
jgi:ClpP class serine protease